MRPLDDTPEVRQLHSRVALGGGEAPVAQQRLDLADVGTASKQVRRHAVTKRMAGDVLRGGGFVILNGVEFDNDGNVQPQATPYPGSNLFSLASGGAIYVRDPHRILVDEQLNGGAYGELTREDWRLILPYLKENERLFDISVEDDLLTVDGEKKAPEEVYRKITALKVKALAKSMVVE